MGETLAPFVTQISNAFSDFNLTTLGTVLVAVVAIAAPLIIGWFAFRRVRGGTERALKRGK